jgi:hypothetical protein
MSRYLKRALEHFYNKEFKEALFNFSLELEVDNSCNEAKVGAMLCDLAFEKEEEAIALFEYYMITKDTGIKNSEEVIEEIINALEFNLEEISEFLLKKEIEEKIDEENGIAYDDFRTIISEKESFKEAFEDIMFSTKVIIHNKEDFLDFLEQLVENGFKEMSMNYFESAVSMFPNDEKLRSLIQKVQE